MHRDWDAAVIATPAQTHIGIARELAAAGLHLFIEKPLSVSMEGVGELRSLVEERRRVVNVGYVHRAHPMLADLRQELRAGRFGQPLQLVAVSGHDFAAARPAYREVYYANRATGGGAIQDALTHIIDMGQWLVGPADSVVCDAAHQRLEGVSVEDTVHVVARQGRTLACYALNQYQCPTENTITIVCERGTVRYELHENRWRWSSAGSSKWHDKIFQPLDRDEWFTRQAHAFLDSVEGKTPPLCPLDDGIAALRTTLAALESLDRQSGRVSTGCVRQTAETA
jgi:predicted dehydrogenase